MKRLILLRHGKSDWDADYGSDHERPLKGRGTRAAETMGRFISGAGEEPQLVVSSSAKRALTTAQLAADAGNWDCEVRVEPALYGASTATVLGVLRELDDGIDSVLLAGHEPTFSTLTGELVGGADVRFPTAAAALIDLRIGAWPAADYRTGTLIWFITPRLLRNAGFSGPRG